MQQDGFESSKHMSVDRDKTQTNLNTHGDAQITLESILMTPYLRSSRLWKHISYAHRRTLVFTIHRWLSLPPPCRLIEMVDFSPKTGLSGPSIQILRNINVVYYKSFLPERYCRNLKCAILQHILPVMTEILSIPMIPIDIALRCIRHDFTIDESTFV